MAHARLVTLAIVGAVIAAGAATSPSVRASAPASGAKKARFELKREMTWADEDANWRKIQSQLGRRAPGVQSDEWHNGALKPGDAKDKIVLVDFWATWCRPCLAAVPHTNEIMESYADRGVIVIGVCNRDGSEKMAQVVKSTGMKFPTARDKTGRMAQDFGVQWWPYYVVIDRKGVVRAAGLRPDKVETVLDALIEEQPLEPAAPAGQ